MSKENKFREDRRDFLTKMLAGGAMLATGGAGALLSSKEAHAAESLPHLNLPNYAKPYVKLYKVTDEIRAFVSTYGFFESRDALNPNKVGWTALKRQMRGALYVEAGDVSYDKEFDGMITKAGMSILASAPRELIDAIDRDMTLSDFQKQEVKNTYASEVLRQFVIKPTMAGDMKELPKWAERQQARMSCPKEEDNFNGVVGFHSIDKNDITREIILMYKKDEAGHLKYAFPSWYPDLNFKIANAEAMEVMDALKQDDSMLTKPLSMNPVIVMVQQQPEDIEKRIEGGWCLGYCQFDARSSNPMIENVDAQLQELIEKVRWDRIRRVAILEPIDPHDKFVFKEGERPADHMKYVTSGRISGGIVLERSPNENPKAYFNLDRSPHLKGLIDRAMETNMGPHIRNKKCSQLSERMTVTMALGAGASAIAKLEERSNSQ